MKMRILLLSIFLCSACTAKKVVMTPPMRSTEVHFGFAKDQVIGSEQHVLRDNVSFLKSNASKMVIVEGHTDQIGSADYNLELGDRRAHEVMSYLVSQGVSPEQIIIVSYGEEQPKNPRKHQDNRRAVVRLTSVPKGENK